MRSITGNIRRATQDMDLDFIRYSLAERLRQYQLLIAFAAKRKQAAAEKE